MSRFNQLDIEKLQTQWRTDAVLMHGKEQETTLTFGFDEWGRPSAWFSIGATRYEAEPLDHGWRKVSGKPKSANVKLLKRAS